MSKLLNSKTVKTIVLYGVILLVLAGVITLIAVLADKPADVGNKGAEAIASATLPPKSDDIGEQPLEEDTHIPDPDELQPIPDVGKLALTQGAINTELVGTTLELGWQPVSDADYFVLCLMDENNNVLSTEILWAEIDSWQINEPDGSKVLILAYKDGGWKGGDDDELISAYFVTVAELVPTPVQSAIPSPTAVKTQIKTAAPQTPKPSQAPNKYKIIVDKSDFSFAIFTYDDNGEYTKLVRAFPCALGRSDKMTPTGTFKISSKGPWKEWLGGEYSPWYTRYTSGLYIHGPIYDSKNFDRLDTNKWKQMGTAATSGCVRTTYQGAKWVYDNCPSGTVIQIVASSDLVSHVPVPPLDPDYPTWDPTDPNKPKASATPEPSATAQPPATQSATPTESTAPTETVSASPTEG